MQTATFLSAPITAPITAANANGRTFTATAFDMQELGWDFENDGYTNVADDTPVTIYVHEDGSTYIELHNVKRETGDDAQTIADLETLRGAHQLEEA
ncbi:hypothetical protein LEM8419_03513 [Neolewinella maritima]|uniref:Uncharacterized protein n=1 Tax=Neolewinella maritima TaxID=1383882 RepID=A0ABN8FAJ0_9BACT|nr:hypothetical protein [Neolewinella maritima]CAH1002641.1 hypothetical protein LEM8419_03513 [Neolewinella maritima]